MPTPASPGSESENDETVRLCRDGDDVVATDVASGIEGRGSTKADALEALADGLRIEPLGDRLSGRFLNVDVDSVREARDVWEDR